MGEYQGLKEFNLNEAKQIVGLKSSSYKDYLAARHLMNANFLHQSPILMNTCLEKELKAYLLVNDVTIKSAKHDSFKLFGLLKHLNSKISNQLNSDFIKVLAKIYRSRYYENLSPGYNFVIIKNQFLAEFDYTFSFIESLTRIKMERDKDIPKSNYEIDKEKKDVILSSNNYLLNGLAKEDYLKQPEIVYEFRIVANHEIIEVLYKTAYTKFPAKFLHDALIPLPNNHSVQLSQP